jgi:hypothetical protein
MAMAGEVAAETEGKTLGERIVEAARLAAAVHLFESLASKSQHYGQQVVIGGAGPRPAPATADRGHSRRPFRIHEDADGSGDDARGAEAGSK